MPTHERLRTDDRDDRKDRREPTIELDEEPAIVVTELDSAAHLAAQHNQLMSERHIFSFKPTLRLEWRYQDGQDKP